VKMHRFLNINEHSVRLETTLIPLREVDHFEMKQKRVLGKGFESRKINWIEVLFIAFLICFCVWDGVIDPQTRLENPILGVLLITAIVSITYVSGFTITYEFFVIQSDGERRKVFQTKQSGEAQSWAKSIQDAQIKLSKVPSSGWWIFNRDLV
jgi:hypothetical protein